MLSFQARKKDPNYLLPVYNYANSSNKIPASGAGSQYANNTTVNYATKKPAQYIQSKPTLQPKPSLYKPYASTQGMMRQSSTVQTPKPVTQPPRPSGPPAPTTRQTPPPAPQLDPMSKYQQIQANRQKMIQSQADSEVEKQNKLTQIRNDFLEKQKPDLENRLNNFRANAQKATQNMATQTELAKEQIRQDSGEEMRLNAQTAREGRGRIQNTLAGLNALDSSVTPQVLAKSEGNLANNQATALRQRNAQLASAEKDLLDYKTNAQALEDDEVAKFNEAIRTIAMNMDLNSAEGQAAAREALSKASLAIYDIEQGIADKELEMQTFYDKLAAENEAKGAGTANNKGNALRMVNNLLGGNYKAISGAFNLGGKVPGLAQITGGAQAQADYDGLKNLLALAERGQLKGSGAVSDFEAKMLEKAALAGLNQNLPEDVFLQRLQQLKADLESGGAVDDRQANQANASLDRMLGLLNPGEQLYINPQTGDAIGVMPGERVPAGYQPV